MQADAPVIVGGENLIDSIAESSGTTADGFFHNLGGSPYNVAVALLERATASPFGPKNPPAVPVSASASPKPKVNMQASAAVGLQPGQ